MIFEKRARIVMILPVPKAYPMFLTIDHIIDELLDLSDGSSETLDFPHVVNGRWYNMRTYQMVHNNVMVVFGDADIDIDDPDLWRRLNQIKREAQYDLKEEIIWITAHEVRRVAEDDFVI
jgi:hypothetical protein